MWTECETTNFVAWVSICSFTTCQWLSFSHKLNCKFRNSMLLLKHETVWMYKILISWILASVKQEMWYGTKSDCFTVNVIVNAMKIVSLEIRCFISEKKFPLMLPYICDTNRGNAIDIHAFHAGGLVQKIEIFKHFFLKVFFTLKKSATNYVFRYPL